MPYLAFDLDAMERVLPAARAAGMAEADLGFGLLRLWEHCWREKKDTVSATHLRGFFAGEPSQVAEALGAFRFLEPIEAGFRVKGADRYLRIAEARSRGGKIAAGNLKKGKGPAGDQPGVEPETSRSLAPALKPETSPGSAPALHRAASSEHRASNELLLPKPAAAAASQIPEPEDFEADSAGEFKPTAWGFWGWHNQERQERELYDEPTPPHKMQAWHDAAQAKVGIPGLILAYLRYLGDPDFRDKGWPFAVFTSEAVWLPRANAPPDAPPKRRAFT